MALVTDKPQTYQSARWDGVSSAVGGVTLQNGPGGKVFVYNGQSVRVNSGDWVTVRQGDGLVQAWSNADFQRLFQ